jgi:hypothetical protein
MMKRKIIPYNPRLKDCKEVKKDHDVFRSESVE